MSRAVATFFGVGFLRPASGTWANTGALGYRRNNHTATLLPNGQVLVAGGFHGPAMNRAELYDVANGTWSPTGAMTGPSFSTSSVV